MLALSGLDAPLSCFLRAETRAAHLEAERVFVRAVKRSEVGGAGPRYLMGLNAALVAWLAREAQVRADCPLRAQISDFLATIRAAGAGAANGSVGTPFVPDGPVLDSDDEIAGAAYAVCGSFLGAAALGRSWAEDVVPGFEAFCEASRALERRWPAFQQALDHFGSDRLERFARARAGAEQAFFYARDIVAALHEAETTKRIA